MRKSAVLIVAVCLLSILSAFGQEKQWIQIKTVNGDTSQNTESFAVGSHEWKIEWSTTGEGLLMVYLHRASDDKMVDLVINAVGDKSATTIIRGEGRYYLKIQATQEYKIAIFDKGIIGVGR